jgi:hypothetical protein
MRDPMTHRQTATADQVRPRVFHDLFCCLGSSRMFVKAPINATIHSGSRGCRRWTGSKHGSNAPSIGRLPYSYTGTRQELVRAATAAAVGHLSTHAFRHSYRSWLDAVGAPVSVQQKLMRHTDIRVTMNTYGDVVTDEMSTASLKVAELVFRGNRAQAERESS